MSFQKILNDSLKMQDTQQPIALASVLVISVILFITNQFTGTTETLSQKLLDPAEIESVRTIAINKTLKQKLSTKANFLKEEKTNDKRLTDSISLDTKQDSFAPQKNNISQSVNDKPIQANKESYKFSIHIESYKTLNKSEQRVAELKRKGFNAFYAETNIPGKGKWFRILIGEYNNSADALKELAELKRKGMFDFAEILNSERNQSQTVLKQ